MVIDRSAERKKWKEEFSAGGVVFRPGEKEPDILLIESSFLDRRGIWSFPKGWIKDHSGETLEQTALREVREEGGVEAEVMEDLGEIHYVFPWMGIKISKTVHYYLMRYVSGDTADHDFEVNEARWVPLSEAKSTITYKNDRTIFERAEKYLKGEKYAK